MLSRLILVTALALTCVTATIAQAEYPAQKGNVPWPTNEWPEIPIASSLRQNLEAEIRRIFKNDADPFFRGARGVVVIKGGELIAECYRDGYDRNSLFVSWSEAKSITQALVGIAVRKGLLAVNDPAPVPEWLGDARANITIDNLLRMSSGLKFEEGAGGLDDNSRMLFGQDSTDVGAYAVNQPLLYPPGTHWAYATGTSMILSRIIRDLVGGTRADYYRFIHQELLDPLGMKSAVPEMDKSGTFMGGTGFYATTRDYARFGLLYLRDGWWDGQRILPEGWVDYTRTKTQGSDGNYAVHFWLNPIGSREKLAEQGLSLPDDMFQARGMGGQFIVIIPSRDVVIAYNGYIGDQLSYAPADLLFARILASLDSGNAD